MLFCPTATAICLKILENEGFQKRADVKVYQVGMCMYDAVLFYKKIARPTKKIVGLLEEVSNRFYQTTVHRAEIQIV